MTGVRNGLEINSERIRLLVKRKTGARIFRVFVENAVNEGALGIEKKCKYICTYTKQRNKAKPGTTQMMNE